METLNIKILNPKAKRLLEDLEALKLISITPNSDFTKLLTKLRSNSADVPTLDEINVEVEKARTNRYEKKM
jgi:hypothetical protein